MTETQGLQWTDAFLLGYEPMDDTHREFVEIVDRLLTCPDAEMAGLLQAFITHAEAHFGLENTWMEETGFPPRDCHISEHKAVMESALQVEDLVRSGDFATGREFAAELANWFPGHADYLDSALAQWMAKRKLGGVPVVLRRNLQFER
ncbi:hemerythrin domain-containing protein [Thauera aminoaromatica]|uniref:Hemerythrin n=1 Tax=Thauera aminoaromatica TaxID=164330 RepID=A0A5C7SB53_THASP|nr:hemerythrin domain-containing protein [Thauera aminoaromatica]TXH81108.1 MAG: hemerythrin [Thauera aminoaromatica]